MNADPSTRRSGFRWRALLAAVVFCGLLGAYWFAHQGVTANAAALPYDQLIEKLNADQVYQDGKHPLELLIEEGSSTQALHGYYSDLTPARDHRGGLHPFQAIVSLDLDKDFQKLLKARGLTPNIRNKSNMPAATLLGFLPILIFFVALALVIRFVLWVIYLARHRPGPMPPR